MKSISCEKCRKQREETLHKLEFQMFHNTLDTAVVGVVAVVIAVMDRRGRSPEYIRKFYEDIKLILDLPTFGGERLSMFDLIETLEEKYGINFDDVAINHESEKEFLKDIKEYEKGAGRWMNKAQKMK